MSLVHQALRKAEAEKNRHTTPTPAAPVAALDKRGPPPPAPSVPVPLPQPEPRTTPANSWLLPATLTAIAAVAIVAIVILVMRTAPGSNRREGEAPAEPPRLASAATAPTPTVAPAPTEPAPVEPVRWKLTGISKDPSGNYLAIINGNLRGVNEYVDGAVIKSIERDRVTLDVNGRETVVRLF